MNQNTSIFIQYSLYYPSDQAKIKICETRQENHGYPLIFVSIPKSGAVLPNFQFGKSKKNLNSIWEDIPQRILLGGYSPEDNPGRIFSGRYSQDDIPGRILPGGYSREDIPGRIFPGGY